jgi:leucyl aminopeptidase
MSNENMQFPIPNSVLEPYIREAVAVSITAALGDGGKMIEEAVAQALAVRVDASGKISNYDSYNKYPIAEVLARRKIVEVARDVINEMAEQMRPKIKEQIERQLKTKHSVIAKALVDGMIDSLSSQWAVKINFSDKE